MWMPRNTIGGIWLTKSPNGMSDLRWRGRSGAWPLWAWLADAVDDDAGQAEHHPGEDDDVTEPGAGRIADAVGHDIEQQAEATIANPRRVRAWPVNVRPLR